MAAGTVDSLGNPYKMTGVVDTATTITANTVTIKKVVWYGVTTAGHKVVLTDHAGRTLWGCTADAPGTSGNVYYSEDFNLPVKGIYSDDMDSGTLLVYVK